MKLIIIGATGMLGQSLVKEAQNRNIEVIRIARSGADINIDIVDDSLLQSAIRKVKPDVIINAAAITDLLKCEENPSQAYLINARAVGIIAEVCREQGAYFIQISTDHYYTGEHDSKHTEDNHVRLLNEYARTKYAGERFALAYSNSLIVRTNIVGFRGNKNLTFIEWVIQMLKNKSKIIMFDDFFTSSIHVKQCSCAIYDLLEKHPTGIINIASREVVSKMKFIQAVASKMGYKTFESKTGSVRSLQSVVRAESLGLDVLKAEVLLGYPLPSMEEVVESVMNEYRGT